MVSPIVANHITCQARSRCRRQDSSRPQPWDFSRSRQFNQPQLLIRTEYRWPFLPVAGEVDDLARPKKRHRYSGHLTSYMHPCGCPILAAKPPIHLNSPEFQLITADPTKLTPIMPVMPSDTDTVQALNNALGAFLKCAAVGTILTMAHHTPTSSSYTDRSPAIGSKLRTVMAFFMSVSIGYQSSLSQKTPLRFEGLGLLHPT